VPRYIAGKIEKADIQRRKSPEAKSIAQRRFLTTA